ncbi:uncharacterized protein LOC114542160 [Dendronephthya gigantea]|uniref:uncharacterized protein LOC114542160 n=1 Tax=Dendronephthya gigantea TaxID=151771 RepID=UPI00106A465A|nr:uncharacterized protein LOC114542160 [Dendronephthya gigantea]
MKYLNYSEKKPKLQISAPIFKENDKNCKVEDMFEYTRDGYNWTTTGGGDSLFSIESETNSSKVLTIESMYLLKQWNGSLVKLNVSCHEEQHCVLLKLQTLFQRHSSEVPPISSTDTTTYTDYDTTTHTYTDQYSSSHTLTDYSLSSTTAASISEHTTEKEDTPSVTSTTGNSNLGLSEESSGGGNSTVIPVSVTITLLLAALAVAIGVLVYYRRRKRTQVPQNNANNLGVVNYNKEIYEDPDRNYEGIKEDATSSQSVPRYNGSGLITNKISPEYETLKENGYEVSFNRPGTSSGANTHVNTDIPRKSEETKMAPVRGPELYHTLEQPPSDDLYNYIDDTKIKNPSASPELEYTYSKDTDIPKNPRQRRVAPKEPELYHTLEQPPSDDFYNYIDNTKIKNPSASPELEYTYSKDTGVPKNPQQTKIAPKGPAVYETLENLSSDDVYNYIDNTNIAKPVTSEQEYTYASDTNLLRASQNGKRKPTASDAVYHTLEQDQPLPSSSEIPSEMEYSYAKSTNLPRKPSATNDDEYSYAKNTDVSSMGIKQNNTGSCAPPTDNDLYHTLEEPNQPNVPVYSTLEEGDAENAQVNENM